MNDLNEVLITGRLTRDPELKETRGGTDLCVFSIAVNRYFKRDTGNDWGEEVSYIEVTAWGLLARNCAQGLVKGRMARVRGRLKHERWQDGKGENHQKVCIVADRIEWQASKPKDDGASTEAEPAAREPATTVPD